MSITIGLGSTEWKDPLGLYKDGGAPTGLGSAAAPAQAAAAPAQGSDFDDIVNTVIAEAGGEGPEGMAAVAHVIKNRAAERGISPAEVVRQPHQFTGYSNPGPGALRSESDPKVRQTAAEILRSVFGGDVPDPTGGADHYHADSVSPSWASSMQPTARIGGHTFYASQPRGRGGNPEAKGLARLAPPDEVAPVGSGGRLTFAHEGQDKLAAPFRSILEGVSASLGRDLTITSGYRSPDHPVEAKKKHPGEHSRHEAADISMKGMTEAERARLVADLRARGAKRFITYSSSPDMLHVDMKDQTGDGSAWFMFDRHNANMKSAPGWFQALDDGTKPGTVGKVPSSGDIIIDGTFKPADPMGLYAGGKNPFEAPQAAPTVQREPQQPSAPISSPIDEIWRAMDAKEPGRYKAIPAADYENWRKEWEARQPSQFMKGLKGALIDQNPELLGNALDALGVLTDSEQFRDIAGAVQDWGKKNSFKRAAKVGSVSDIRTDSIGDFISDATDYAAFSLGSGLGSMAPSVAVGAGTAAVTLNPVVGFIAGSAGPSYVQNLGDVYGALRDDPNIQKRIASGELTEKQIAGWAAAAAVPMAALDSASLGKVLDVAGDGVKRSIIRRVVKGVSTGALTEGATEGLQEVVSQGVQEALGADKSLADQAIAVADNAIGGALAGGAAGGAAGVAGRHGGGVAEQPAPTREGPPTPAVVEPVRPAKKGPLVSALEHGERRAAENLGATFVVTDPAIADIPAGEMDGQEVAVSPDQTNVPDGMRRVSTSDGRDAIIGEKLLTPRAIPATAIAPSAPKEAPPAATAPASGGVAPADVPAGAPPRHATVRIDAEGIEPFMARVEGYEGDEVVVFDASSGEVYQVPLDAVTEISPPPSGAAMTAAGAPADAAPEAPAAPATPRQKTPAAESDAAAPPADPMQRAVAGKAATFPDEAHARLFDLGEKLRNARQGTTPMSRVGKLLGEVRETVAGELGVPVGRINEIADDYRYRVARASKAAGGRFNAPPLNEKRLAGWRAERAKAGAVPVETVKPALDIAAHDAATSPNNDLPEPTQAQKEAGNYKVGHVRLAGLDISIENPEGSTRSGVSASGKRWSNRMKSHYGYIRGTVGRDKDHIDIFVKPGAEEIPESSAAGVFVVDQVAPGSKKFDEHKVMFGYATEDEARQAYQQNYAKGWKGLGAITEASIDEFKAWLADGDTTRPFAKWRTERNRPKNLPIVEAENTFSPLQQRASDRIATPGSKDTSVADSVAEARRPKAEPEKPKTAQRMHWDLIPIDEHTHPFAVARNRLWEFANALSDEQYDQLARDFQPSSQFAFPQMVGNAASERTVDALIDEWSRHLGAHKPVKAESQKSGKAERRKPQRAELSAKGRIVAGIVGAGEGQTVIPSADVEYSRAGTPNRIEKIDRNGEVHVMDPATGARTSWSFAALLRARKLGTTFTVVEGEYADTESAAADVTTEKADSESKKADVTTEKADSESKKADSVKWGADNKLITADRAEELRRQLREKLRGQLTAGIDPEVLALGTQLAAFHIEAGARRFVDFARAIAGDMGVPLEKLRPFLRAWYNGARDLMEDSGLDIAGTDDAEAVRAALAELEEDRAGPAELDQPGQGPLEGAPAEAVRRAPGGRDARQRPARSGQPDLFGGEPARGERVPAGRGVADGKGELPASSAGEPATGAATVVPDARDGEARGERRENLPDRVEYPASAATPAALRPVEYTLGDADELGSGGQKAKFRDNLAAIRLLRDLDAEHRPATRDEQSVLAKWVGWGGLRQAFPREDGSVAKGWDKEAADLKALMTPEEYRAAEASTRNAHYTSPEVVRAMWRLVQRLGFKGGLMLEPSVGAGNFIGFMPGALRDATKVTGVELDHITGGIAKNLYPAANIQAPKGFQTITVPDGYFDLAIGNPPFGSEKLYDADRRHLNKFSIHNYFFAKSIDGVKPGGVLAMVVTNYFLDAADGTARRYIADRADLLGAIRLPNNAFQKNAGTEVTTDIIVLRRRPEGEAVGDQAWADVGEFTDKEGRTVPLNRYFIDNPDMMLGEFGAYGTMYHGDEAALVARPGDDLPRLLDRAIRAFPEAIMAPPGVEPVTEAVAVPSTVEDATIGSIFLSPEGKLFVRDPDRLGEAMASPLTLPNEKAVARVAGMVRVRDAFARLRRAQIDERATDARLDGLRAKLNKLYDAFVKSHGPINQDANRRLFRDDPTWPQISALEEGFDKGVSAAVAKSTGEQARPPSAGKAPIFFRRTQQPYSRPTSASSAKDALATVLADRGRVDLDDMVRLYRKPKATIIAELGSLLWLTPSGAYETADQYLSGNVKAKLAEARRAAETDSAFRRNVAALEEVIPADIEAVDIDVKPGAPWVPAGHVRDFVNFIAGNEGGKAFYSRANAKWVLDVPRTTDAADAQWATDRTSVDTIVSAVMNGQAVTVYDRLSDGRSVVNQQATDNANEKVERVKAEWRRWLWEDETRRDELARIYNDTFNTDVQRRFDGSHLTLPGKVGDDVISLRPHQKSFVWRALQSSTTLADHVVGSGKTFELIAAIMEMRRIGQARKPMLTVPNHLVGQWAADFIKLYPGAKVLAATKKDFEAENRKRLFARVTTGDWDVVIVAHSSFGKIGVHPEFERRFIEEQIADMESSVAELRRETGEKSRTVAQINKAREMLRTKLQRLLDAGAKDDGMTFDEMGIDALLVDEAHEFKNLGFSTSMTRVAGLGNPAGSQKAADLYMKVLSVMERTGGRNIVFATGTPLSNTMAEMYTVQRYLDGQALKDLGVAHFDAWARVFGEVVTDWELSPSGQYRLNSRFARFVNMPELMQRYLSFADVITNDDIKAQLAAIGKTLPLPKVKGGKPQNVVVERSDDQAAYIGEGETGADGVLHFPEGSLVYRAEHLPRRAEKGGDNMLKVMSDARKAALDMRLINPSYPDVPGSKVHVAADQMKAIYDRWHHKKGTQLVFIDLSTPKKAKAREEARIREIMRRAEEGDEAAQEALDAMSPDEFMALDGSFSVYDDLKEKLVQRGVPAAEIAFIHDANTDLQKEELFGKVRSGRIRLLFGSTPKMGAGTNVQNRLVALHHLDAPWRPSDLEQRDGRGIRQGNELYAEDPDNFEIEILRYATKNTLDARQWQTIEAKARFIQQMRKGGVTSRVIEDIAGEAANAAEMKAAASGNPLILEEMDLRQKLRRLEGQSVEHDREQHRIALRIRSLRGEGERIAVSMEAAVADAERAKASFADTFPADFPGVEIEKPKDMGAAIIAAGRKILKDRDAGATLGVYAGFTVELGHSHTKAFDVILTGQAEHTLHIADIDEADPVGLARRIMNSVRDLIDRPAAMRERAAEIEAQIPALERQRGPWKDEAALEETAARHRAVLAELQPKQAPAAATPQPDQEPQYSLDEPVARITGEELGVAFGSPGDMPALRSAAQRWYAANLQGKTVVAREGREVRFSGASKRKSTGPNKTDLLLRAVPAIRAIIERGVVVDRQPGNRQGVRWNIIIAAPVSIDERIVSLAVTVHERDNGSWQYDFGYDRDGGSPGVSVPGEPAARALSRRSAEKSAPVQSNIAKSGPDRNEHSLKPAAPLNLFEWPEPPQAGLDTPTLSVEEQQEVMDIVRRVAGLDDVTFTQRIELPYGSAAWGTTAPSTAGGFYQAASDAVTISLESGRPHVAYHEAFHRLQALFLSDRERAILRVEAGKLRRIVASNEFRRAQVGKMNQSELEAEAFAIYSTGRATTVKPFRTIRQAWDRIVDMIDRVRNFLAGRGYATTSDVFEAARRGETSARVAKPRKAGATSYSLTENRILEEVGGRLTDLQPAVLKTIPLNYFAELARPGMTAVGEYLRVKRLLDAYRGRKHADADAIAQEWLKFTRLGYGLLPSADGKAKAAQLASLMHDATLAGVDPTKTDSESRAHPSYDALRQRLTALPQAGRELFSKVRDAYKAQSDELDRILLDNVRKAQEIAQRRAEADYRREIERIKTANLKPKVRKDALDDAERSYKAAATKSQWSMKARLTKMRLAFEASRVVPPYFPLARFGRYFVTALDVDGKVLSFSRRERAADRDRLAADLRKAYPTARIEVGVTDNASELRQAMDPRLVAEIEEIVGGAGIDPSTMSLVLDQIWQRYLETMPDLSVRKRFIHRKGTAGFDADALRAFSSHMFHAAHQMARLKYGLELQELTNDAADQARKSDDPTKGVTLANELRNRHKWVMNPTGSAVAQTMTSVAFVWYLASTPAAAIVNLTQTPVLGIPILAGRFGGFAKASAAMLKASYDSVAGHGSVTRANLSSDEKAALEAFYESGLIDRTQSHDIAGVGETGVNYSPLRARVMAGMSWLFHRAEVWNREVTALAAYRMARDAGQNVAAAIDTAHDLTWKAHFDYSNSSRPAVLQNDVAKVALVFRAYNINMLYRLFRDFRQSFKGDTPQARREARTQLAGVLGMMSLMAGVSGVAGFHIAMALAGMVLGDDDDPMDFEQQFRRSVLELLGPQLGGVVLDGAPGHYLGVDLTSRIGMPDLWFRSPSRDLQGKDEYDYWIMNSLGATVSLGGDFYRGISMISDGNVEKGVEAIVPKWARDLMKAWRYANEGLTSYKGDELIPSDAFDPWDVIAQAIGFTPAKVAETYERNNALKDAERRVLDRRRTLMNAFALATSLGDEDGRRDAIEAIKRFNAVPVNRPLAITPETLRRSLAARERNARKREDGVFIANPRLGRKLRESLPERVY